MAQKARANANCRYISLIYYEAKINEAELDDVLSLSSQCSVLDNER